MKDFENPTNYCECRWPRRAVARDQFPVTFDKEMGEYHLTTTPSGYAIMRYCPWCGGAFPKSKRDNFFTQPNDKEISELNELIESFSDADGMRLILGHPDHTSTGLESKPWACQYTYSHRWDSIEFVVHESGEGELTFSYGGKPIDQLPLI